MPKAIVATASIACDNPKKRMNESISGSRARSSRGTSRRYSGNPASRKTPNATGTAGSGLTATSVNSQ